MQSTGKELPAVSCVGYNKKDETIFPAGTSNLQKAKVERLSLHMQVSEREEETGMKKRGIAKAVEQEILASYEQLYRLAITYVKNEQDAMDVVQESAYKAMKNAGQVKEETYIKTWLWRIVINTSLDMCKKQKRIVSGVFIPEEAKEDVYKDWDMLAALEELEERERTIVILKYFEEWKIDDIADLLKENPNTVKSILYRSLKKLKIKMSREEIA